MILKPPLQLTFPGATGRQGQRSMWVCYPQGLLRCQFPQRDPQTAVGLRELRPMPHRSAEGKDQLHFKPDAASVSHSLFQESFFVCTVKSVGDIPGTGSVYVEAVVDCDSGNAFAKVYPSRNAMNAVDILADVVLPYFRDHRISVKLVFTRTTEEYCGLPPAHAYETFLMAAHIQHQRLGHSDHMVSEVCEDFFQPLLREFFPAVFRKKFDLSLSEIQKELNVFVKAYNLTKKEYRRIDNPPSPAEPADIAKCRSAR
jgi:hypothetical protein